jgi:hypothetical protein
MPRRHNSARERSGPLPPRPLGGVAPGWAQTPGYRVQQVTNDGTYRCPGCDHEVRPGTSHLVVIPEGSVDERRHWHTPCWQTELRRRR